MTDNELLTWVGRSPGQRAGYKQLTRELGIGGGRERRLLREQLNRLTESGQLRKVDREHWALAPRDRGQSRLVGGRLELHRDGYGFVRPEPPNADGSGDVFIPPTGLEGAMHGDRVLVELSHARDGYRAERRSGRVVRILEHHHPTVVGIFHHARSGRRGDRTSGDFVTPLDTRVGDSVLILPGVEIPLRPITADRVIGRESQGHEIRARKAADLEGLVVDVAIVDWPTSTRPARGRVIEVLGERDAFGVDVEIIIRKHHLPHVFPDKVLREARAVAIPPQEVGGPVVQPGARQAQPSTPADSLYGRRDFRDLPIVTIDGETARDFDDAVLVRDLPDGGYELQVHIADVAHYVRPEAALDHEARLRGNSVYFPDRAVPMLPLDLSANVCSLRPEEDRLVLSCILRLGPEGEVLSSDLCEGVIRSAHRMTYAQVHAILSGDVEMRERFASLVPEFERMHRLALKLHARRERRGSIDFDLPEPVIEFDEQGQMRGITRAERTWANRLIEEFMLAANESVAGWIESLGVPSLYRIHEKPDAVRVANFEEIAAQFGYSLGVGPLPVKRIELKGDRRQRLRHGGDKKIREMPEDIDVTPQMYQKLAARLVGKPEERILTHLMLRSLKQARYSEQNEGHFALATSCYTHFTSPIRRYPDLIVHRIVKALLAHGVSGHRQLVDAARTSPSPRRIPKRGSSSAPSSRAGHDPKISPPVEPRDLAAIAQETSQCERRAADAERELIEWKKVRFMQDKIGDEFSGIVLSVTKFGMFVELDDLFVEGLIPLDTLPGDRYCYGEHSRQIIGESSRRRFSVGDRLTVILDRIDAMENRLLFALAEESPIEGRRTARAKGATHPRKRGSGSKEKRKKPKRR